jgi:hypothetical protein
VAAVVGEEEHLVHITIEVVAAAVAAQEQPQAMEVVRPEEVDVRLLVQEM